MCNVRSTDGCTMGSRGSVWVGNCLCLDHDGKGLFLKSVEYNEGLCERDGKI